MGSSPCRYCLDSPSNAHRRACIHRLPAHRPRPPQPLLPARSRSPQPLLPGCSSPSPPAAHHQPPPASVANPPPARCGRGMGFRGSHGCPLSALRSLRSDLGVD
ncbi:hypothetical protein ACLOJK_038284 [Asimina triloba]